MLTLIGVSGSLRRASYNSAVLRAAAGLMPAASELLIESIADIPLYDGDAESTYGIPEPVAALKNAIAAADGLLWVTPEYNHGVPGVAKNAIDWLSRPPGDIPRVFGGKPVALAGASSGGFGTILSQNAWLPTFRTLGAEVWPGGRLLIARAASIIDANGEIIDPVTQDHLAKFVSGFVEFVRKRGGGRGAKAKPSRIG